MRLLVEIPEFARRPARPLKRELYPSRNTAPPENSTGRTTQRDEVIRITFDERDSRRVIWQESLATNSLPASTKSKVVARCAGDSIDSR
jgi:hypothetical protein